MAFTVQLADLIIHMEHIYPELKRFCKDYLSEEGNPDFTVSWTEEDIEKERGYMTENEFTPIYLETLVALRKISEVMPSYDRFLMHGAVISYDNNAFMFTAPSGTGKSTHIRLWKKYLGDKVGIVNGDKPFLALESDAQAKVTANVYGTPWAGKENWQRNCAFPLKGICFLQRSVHNTIRRLEPAECLSWIFKQVYLPSNADAAGKTLELIDTLIQNVPVYMLGCDMSEEAVRCSFEAMTGLSYDNTKNLAT